MGAFRRRKFPHTAHNHSNIHALYCYQTRPCICVHIKGLTDPGRLLLCYDGRAHRSNHGAVYGSIHGSIHSINSN